MIFTLNDFAVSTTASTSKGPKTMNRLRCFLFAAIVVISSTTLGLGGEMQAPGKSNVTPTPTPTALTATSDDLTQPTSTEEIQIVWQDATTILVEILLTIF
jgi:hypothetical protein